ncbi:hypothetical protein DPMN_006319 [Dreissena polymorpha]|uniref:Uncharacterized protein n=1 Tax=Dreissena polymorpha TaxID=45954 RepID=A0A9D4MR89_DREPO|nr:hypothetical protein DPMN_006319 [Dreissena polymorpha]
MSLQQTFFVVNKETPLVLIGKHLTTYVLPLNYLVFVGLRYRQEDVGVDGLFLVIHRMVVEEVTITAGAVAMSLISCKERVLKHPATDSRMLR